MVCLALKCFPKETKVKRLIVNKQSSSNSKRPQSTLQESRLMAANDLKICELADLELQPVDLQQR